MYLKELRLANFKNCESADLTFSENVNCFVGLNGAGKTNILDSIYYLSFCKSFFGATDKLNIRHDQDFFSIHGTYGFDDKENELVSCVQKRDAKKSFRFNKKEYDRLSDHIGKFPLVMISPYDRDLINDGSELRRKFIDGVISQFDPLYLSALLKYNRALLQRNMQLRQFADTHHFDRSLLQLWDDQLCTCADDIHLKRKQFLEEFHPIFQHYYEVVSGAKEKVQVRYSSKLDTKSLHQLLEENLQQDTYSCYTNVGIHKDDLDFFLDGHPLKKFGSQGQQKSFVVSIRLAQFEYNYQKIGYKPILLLDDIFDKLDDQRVMKLVRLVGDDHFGQVFITDTQQQRIERLFEDTNISHRIFEVEAGHVKLIEHE
ncbi:MAG: DNA replication/repair protein RecF [Bacteroidales bacterium]|jgi:DNA replication and repair protein RecF|nr:DNA replication/repair protein RecF [Bacteroidales bacterium]